VKDIPKVGGTKNPDLDAIDRAAPDLVFVNAEENRKEDFERLAVKYRVHSSMPKSVTEVPTDLRRFGELVDRREAAERRALELEAALEELEAKARAEPRFRYAYLIWKKPWMTVGDDTYVADLFRRAGGDNVYAAATERYPETTLEALVAHRPERVFLPDEPYPFGDPDRLDLSRSLPDARIALISGDDCCWHGVRSLRGVRLMMALLKSS
jgi:iron complex transport system substrate-binding protein